MGLLGTPKIIPYISFGDVNNTYITGEVIRGFKINKPQAHLSIWQNILATAKRYIVNDIEGIEVEVSFNGMTGRATTNEYGIFRCEFNHPGIDVKDKTWQKATIRIIEKENNYPADQVECDVMVVNGNPDFGIISDIDDTIMVSYATQKLMKLKLLLFNNAHTRMPFEGVSAFYNALKKGKRRSSENPIFYLSNSEWNLYDLIHEFIMFNRIPKGPLFLRELKINPFNKRGLREIRKNHKQNVLHRLFSTLPDLNFILIGDSGQHDPEVYADIVGKFPGRVLSIYIRDIGIPENALEIKTISEKMHDEYSVEMVLVKDTEAAAKHAISKGFISPDYLTPVLEEKQKDKAGE